MLEVYITKLEKGLESVAPTVMDKENFLLIIGSLFLLGAVTKWIVWHHYGKLIRRAENMQHTKNATIRQIKNKYEGIRQVNGELPNTLLFVKHYVNKSKLFYIPIRKIDNIIRYCVVLIMGFTAIAGWYLYNNSAQKNVAFSYVLAGIFVALSLEMTDRMVNVEDRKSELAYSVADNLENSARYKGVVTENTENILDNNDIDVEYNKNMLDNQEFSTSKIGENDSEEQILNQVIGEFLQ
ncbi:MAG: hypothetical protein V8R90_07475 [Eubacterium sp.]